MFCNGIDTCVAGRCRPTGTNPCLGEGTCCDERSETCVEQCGAQAAECAGPNGSPCDDENPCTSDDECVFGLCRGSDNGLCTGTCNNGVIDPGEECDSLLDDRCPGVCGTDCLCHEVCANSVDDDGDGEIDCQDTECQGRPCECLPIGRDPGRITFGTPGHDRLMIHGTVSPCEPLDWAGSEVAGVLTNAKGVVAAFTLPAGSLVQRAAKRFTFNDRTARATRSGLAKLRISGKRNSFLFQLHGDLSDATDPTMTFQFRVGEHVFVHTGTWKKTSRGWSLSLPGE
jgi:hypothetical protein